MESRNIKAEDLYKDGRTFEDVKAILKAEGNLPCEDTQFKEWWDIFELSSQCNKAGLSELEKWCVLRGRFKLVRK
jgi:hypothetical protein